MIEQLVKTLARIHVAFCMEPGQGFRAPHGHGLLAA